MKKKQTALVIAIALALLAIVGCICIVQAHKKLVVAFYRLSEREIRALTSVLGDGYAYVTYNNDTSLYSQTKKKPAVLFTVSGNPLDTAISMADAKAAVPLAVLGDITSSVRESLAHTEKNEVAAVPVLSSHFEIDIHRTMLCRTGIETIVTWEDIEAFARAAKREFPDARIRFAGKSGETTVDLLGALAEAFGGKAHYDAAVEQIRQAIAENAENGNQLHIDNLAHALCDAYDSPLFNAVQYLKKLYRDDLLGNDTFAIDKKTLAAFIEQNLVSVMFMSLDDHREADTATMSPFASIYLPSDSNPATRAFTAPITYAVPFRTGKKIRALVESLADEEQQEALSRATGLAPVLARCRTPDRQADDARYWIAATNTPVAGLSRESTLSDEQLNALATAFGYIIQQR